MNFLKMPKVVIILKRVHIASMTIYVFNGFVLNILIISFNISNLLAADIMKSKS